MLKNLIGGLILALLSSGCALSPPQPTLPPDSPTINWLEHVEKLTLLNHWRAKGKAGFKTANDGGSAYFDWAQSDDNFHIRLSGPLGQGTAILSGNDTGAKLTTSDDQTYISDSPEQLLYERTGWYLPLQELLYWIKGLPAPFAPYQETRTPNGLIETLIQGPWTLQYSRYRNHLGIPLPGKIKITREDIRVTLAVKSWALLDDS